MFHVVFFFFKQKTAYEMRISDWSSDVCSSDLCSMPSSSDERGENHNTTRTGVELAESPGRGANGLDFTGRTSVNPEDLTEGGQPMSAESTFSTVFTDRKSVV